MKNIKLFCIPHAGGSAAVYSRWKKYLDSSIELIPVELSGRGIRMGEKLYDSLKEAIELAEYLRDIKYQPEQVQDFYPTPGTLSTTMFYTGIDPRSMKEVYVPKSKGEKAMQRALLQYSAPRNYDLVHAALVEAGREDLIGFGPKCLIKPKDARGSLNRQFDKNKKHNKSNDRNSRGGKNNKNTDRRNNKSNSRDNRSSSSKGKKRNKR